MDIPEQQPRPKPSLFGYLQRRVSSRWGKWIAVAIPVLGLVLAALGYLDSRRTTQEASHLVWRTDVLNDGERLLLVPTNTALAVQGVTVTFPKSIRAEPLELRPGELELRATWLEADFEELLAGCARSDHVTVVMESVPVLVATRYLVARRATTATDLYTLHHSTAVNDRGFAKLSLTSLARATFAGPEDRLTSGLENWRPETC